MLCCSARPPEYRRVPADRIPDLIPLLVEVTRPGDALRTYRCRECGQMWQQHDVDGEALVVQVGWANRPRPSPPPPVARPRLTPNAPPPPLRWRRRGGLAAFVLLAAVFFAISTLPPFVSGPLARGAWLARWIVGGILLVLAVQTVVDLARRPGRKA
jgi:hypothetical protein